MTLNSFTQAINKYFLTMMVCQTLFQVLDYLVGPKKCDCKVRWRALLCDGKLTLKSPKMSHTIATQRKQKPALRHGRSWRRCGDSGIFGFKRGGFQPFLILLSINRFLRCLQWVLWRQKGEGLYFQFWTLQCATDSSSTAVCVWKLSNPASWNLNDLGVHRDRGEYFQIYM